MASYKTVPVTEKQFKEIIKVLQYGVTIDNKTKARIEPNPTIALLLTAQGNLGLRIGDMLQLTMDSFKTMIYADDTQGYYIDIKEEKTDKQRNKQVHPAIYNLLLDYTTKKQITSNKPIFQVSVRTVQNKLKKVCDYLGYKNLSTHSFRKLAANKVYEETNHDIKAVQDFLQHSDIKTTQRYIKANIKSYNTLLNNTLILPS